MAFPKPPERCLWNICETRIPNKQTNKKRGVGPDHDKSSRSRSWELRTRKSLVEYGRSGLQFDDQSSQNQPSYGFSSIWGWFWWSQHCFIQFLRTMLGNTSNVCSSSMIFQHLFGLESFTTRLVQRLETSWEPPPGLPPNVANPHGCLRNLKSFTTGILQPKPAINQVKFVGFAMEILNRKMTKRLHHWSKDNNLQICLKQNWAFWSHRQELVVTSRLGP